jgi:hypothetical protein
MSGFECFLADVGERPSLTPLGGDHGLKFNRNLFELIGELSEGLSFRLICCQP